MLLFVFGGFGVVVRSVIVGAYNCIVVMGGYNSIGVDAELIVRFLVSKHELLIL
jgi:hypothetical protein